jgi:hypothetical protein
MGKTSLLQTLDMQAPQDVVSLCINLQRASAGDPARLGPQRFQRVLLYTARRQRKLDLSGAKGARDVVELVEMLAWTAENCDLTLWLLWDETELLADLPQGTLMGLRAVLQDHTLPLRTVLAASKGLGGLNDRAREWQVSPFLFGFATRFIPPLSQEAAQALITQKAHPAGEVTVSHEALTTLLNWCGGHPYLLQALCLRLYEPETRRLRHPTARDLDRVIQEEQLGDVFQQDYDNLSPSERVILHSLTQGEMTEDDLLACLDLPQEGVHNLVVGLTSVGLAKKVNGSYQIGNALLERWLRSGLAETRTTRLSDQASVEIAERTVNQKDPNPSAQFEHGYALLIGVGADLPVTVDDAQGLGNILTSPQRCAYPKSHVKVLTEEAATRQGILDGLDWLKKQTERGSEATAVVYFSGHGGYMPGYHLVPFGYEPPDLEGTAISGAEFTAALRAIEAKKLLILLDCCHAGGMATAKAKEFTKAPVPPELRDVLTAGSGRVLIASSRRDEVSYTGTPYSVFTQALREALAGHGAATQDGYATVADVAMYVGRVVPNRTQDRQHPILDLSAADNFAVAYYAGGAKTPRPLEDAQGYPLPIQAVDVDLIEGYQKVLKTLQMRLLEVEARMAHFYDEAAIPLDLERIKKGLLRRIKEKEAEIEARAQKSGWTKPATQPTGPTLEDVYSRLDQLGRQLGQQLDDLKRGQRAIYRHLPPERQEDLELILQEIRLGHVARADLARTLDAIRRALKYNLRMQEDLDADLRQGLEEIEKALNRDLSLQQQTELSLPIIPLLLNYKVSFSGDVDLEAVWQELMARIH